MPPIPEEEAATLRKQFSRLGVSAGQVSRVLGLNEATVRHWLSGRSDIPLNVAAILSHIIAFHHQKPEHQDKQR